MPRRFWSALAALVAALALCGTASAQSQAAERPAIKPVIMNVFPPSDFKLGVVQEVEIWLEHPNTHKVGVPYPGKLSALFPKGFRIKEVSVSYSGTVTKFNAKLRSFSARLGRGNYQFKVKLIGREPLGSTMFKVRFNPDPRGLKTLRQTVALNVVR